MVGFRVLSLVAFACLLSSPTVTPTRTFPGAFILRLDFPILARMMLVGVWLGLHWVSFSFFDDYTQNSIQ